MTPRRLFPLSLIIAVACGFQGIGLPTPVAEAAPLQTCTAQTTQGFPISGNVCGGTTYGFQCSAGVIYKCDSGPRFQQNNCTLDQVCSVGCFTRPSSATSTSDVCFSGARPLTLSTTNTLGGNDLGLTVTLAASHPSGAFTNLKVDRGDLVPGQYCGVPNILASQTSVSFALPTAVVTSPVNVSIFADIAYTDASGVNRQLVPVPSVLTLNPGGTEPPAPEILQVTLTPSTIAPGGVSLMVVELAKMAPARGIPISVSSSDPSVASVIANAQPIVLGGCIYSSGTFTIQAASSVPSTTTVTISSSSGAPGQAPVTTPLTVTAGCTPKTCLEIRGGTVHGGPCGTLADGCGGTVMCGCDFGETCGGGGVAGQCGTAPSPGVSAVSLNPTSVTGGSSSAGTVTLSMAAPAGGMGVFLSSSSAVATVPGSVVVPAGQTSAGFTVTTSAVTATNAVTISASSNGTASAVLTVTPAASCTPTTCGAQGKNCGTISNGCGGTLSCGACTAPQTCGGGGVANVCGCTPTTCAAQGKNCGTIGDGCGGTLSCGTCAAGQVCTVNVCCTPTTCAAQGKNCGTIADGCGGTLTCGTCTVPQTCGGGGVANVCGGGCTPTTCAAQGKNCGAIADGCGGTLTCGACTAPSTCGGGGVANVCGCTPTTCAAQGKNCGSISDGCGGTLTCGTCTAPQTCGSGGVANVCGTAPACSAGNSQVTLTVNGQLGSVTSNPSGLNVSTGQTASACFPNNQRVEFQATRAANWSGATCDGGNTNQDKCRITLGTTAVSLTAALL